MMRSEFKGNKIGKIKRIHTDPEKSINLFKIKKDKLLDYLSAMILFIDLLTTFLHYYYAK